LYFFTATFNNWQLLLAENAMKIIVANLLPWMLQNKRARTPGFVIVLNNNHFLWSPVSKFHEKENEQTMLSFTGHTFKKP
jgi:hypothetical protein